MSPHLFSTVFRGSSQIVHYGEVMQKLQEAASYNDQHNLAVSNSKKKLPNVNMIKKQDFQTQTDFLPTCTIDRFYIILFLYYLYYFILFLYYL